MKIKFLILALVIIGTQACGPRNMYKVPVSDESQNGIESKVMCSMTSPVNPLDTADYAVALPLPIINIVLNELIYVPVLSVTNFWSQLKPSTRDRLSFELNSLMPALKGIDSKIIFKASALFFIKTLGSFNEFYEYRIRDSSGVHIGFKAYNREVTTVQSLASICAGEATTNITPIKLPDDLVIYSNVDDIISCRTMNESIDLVLGRNRVLLRANNQIFSALTAQTKLKDKPRRLSVEIKTYEITLDLMIKKKDESELVGRRGRKSNIRLNLSQYAIDEEGACVSLKSTF